jgi:hypothetical protein
VNADELCVAVDDLDLVPGKQEESSHNGNNVEQTGEDKNAND